MTLDDALLWFFGGLLAFLNVLAFIWFIELL